ncbi:unnamed protein product [Hymenolepis diminuta]|uniref:DNA-directed RNA polymerase I subunit RPA43 n=1 Tax=Hymenolepis diminuta TaxID=6216 RepID=A0A0R3SJ93_HYMDI|nr:unnamed protein product [Hymenolepis diminuta]
MNDVQWNLSITMNPLQLSTPRTAFESYLKPLMNKYIPDLKGILIQVDHQTLKVNFVVNATILCPTVGQQVDADIRVVKSGRLVCRFGDNYSIFVTVPTCGEEAIDTIPVDPQTGEPLKLFVGDKVCLEITHVNLSLAGDVLRLSGRVLSVISRSEFSQKKIQSRDKTATKQTAEESIEQENVSKKRKKHKKHVEEQQQTQEIPEETDLERPKKKKKRKSEVPVPPESSEMEAELMPPKKKDKKSRKVKKKKHSGDDLLAVKRDPDEAANEPEEQEEESFFQVSNLVSPPMKGDPILATGMESPDIFSSEDEDKISLRKMYINRAVCLK